MDMEKLCGDEIVFKDDNGSCHRAKEITDFLRERQIKPVTWQMNSSDQNPNENLRGILKILSIRRLQLLTAIQERWNILIKNIV